MCIYINVFIYELIVRFIIKLLKYYKQGQMYESLSVIGTTKTGKTTTIENIIMELRRRRYTVGSVKEFTLKCHRYRGYKYR